MFVMDAWYMAAWADEIEKGGMLARKLLNRSLVLYRLEDGTVAALEDRCCHKGLPLSMGCVVGDHLQCGYHGLVFDKHGKCVKVPGQERIPASAKVASYRVVEQDHIVWIWMGDASKATCETVPRHEIHDDPDWTWVKDRYLIKANYQLITDNLMDLTHVGYVHQRTIGGTPEAHSEAEMSTTRLESGVRITRWLLDSVPPPSYLAAHTFGTPRVDRWMEIEFFPPAVVRIHTGAVDTGTGAREGNRAGGFAFMGLNLQTPETEKTTHYFWSGARLGKPERAADTKAELLQSLPVTFGEDKIVVEAQQTALDENPDAPHVMIASDAGLAHARRIVSELLAKEASERSGQTGQTQ
ncbi:Toluene-4-sulfonate monooxygenase system iron-sulfur subunit TsaM1 [Paraburkholderia hiiakae]|uniref:Toluene-4-sulfonate monooxygenase system iron-sulfur subunit TsaM1 n=1 Tax=Paraburkholderia hiiakae TaxID=1081782 RepID=A0ABN7IG26_9BURK|nr:aromatic ring-hydroxylating dioxygenase subunit alpha [Paraburkholderia hiiakae]CAD6562084.1 Toluene-4-sulfonate monooxygenase system iron-sulfur subunit TsaM1 [Paraburkholderia hiiakae]